MATITSTAAGNWSAGGTWIGGAAPVDGDKAVINHTVTVDDTSRAVGVDGATDSILIGAAGTLKWSRTANSLLTLRGRMKLNAAGAQFDMGKVGDEIPAAYTAGLVLNKHAGSPGYVQAIVTNGALSSYGFYIAGDTGRTRVTTLTSSVTAGTGKTFTVDDATGWQIGDEVLVGHSNAANPAAAQYEVITLTAIAPLTANFTYGHLSGCFAGNMESNVEISSFSSSNPAGIWLQMSALTAQTIEVRNARFLNIGRFANGQGGVFLTDGATGSNVVSPVKSFHANVSQFDGSGYDSPAPLLFSGVNRAFTVTDWVVNIPASFTGASAIALNDDRATVNFDNCLICAANLFYTGTNVPWQGSTFNGGQICISQNYFTPGIYSSGSKYVGTIISGYGIAFGVTQNPSGFEFERCDIGLTHGWNARLTDNFFRLGGTSNVILRYKTTDCDHATDFSIPTAAATLANLNPATRCEYVNKGGDLTQQEIYLYSGTVIRENSLVNRGTSSLKIQPTKLVTDTKHTTTVSATNGESVQIVGYCRFDTSFYNANDYTAPTVKILTADGTVLATYTATSAANGAWEKFDITGTNSTGADAILTIEFNANAKTVTTGKVYFDGVAVSPFVTKCRHYGFLFDESNPKRAVNATVSASEATAAAYTGMTVTWGASSSTTSVTADNTFQKLYDYTQAQGCLNIASAMPITGAGVAGNPVLFAQGNVTITTGDKVNGAGSLSMGAFTLTTEFATAGAYTYTGGTWSQATTVPSFGGGTANIGAAGTYEFDTTGTVIVNMTPTGAGTYAMEDVTANGVLDLRNATAHNIIVELSTATAALAITSNSPGPGTITVTAPTVTADISVTSMPNDAAGTTRLQIFNSTARDAAAWAANTVYATGAIVKRSAGIGAESTAGLYFRATAGGTSHATTEPTWDTTPGNTTTDGGVTWTCYKVLFYDADPASTSYTDTYIDGEEFKAGEVIGIRFAEMNGSTSFKTYSTEVVATAAGFSALVAEEADSVFATFGVDGSTMDATFSSNFTSDYIVLDSNTDFAGKGAFAYYCYVLTTSQGMYEFWDGVTGIDPGNIRINVDTLNLYFDESAGFVKQTDDVRVFRSDGTRPVIDPTTGGHGVEMNWRTPVSVVTTGGSALTAPESAHLLSLPSAAAVATAVVEKVIP